MKKNNPQAPKKKVIKPDHSTNVLYDGKIPSVVGRRRILVKGKNDYVFVDNTKEAVTALKERLGPDFIRDLGVVKKDHKIYAK